VRQIVADVQWPAAMVWNGIQPENEYEYDKDHTFKRNLGEKCASHEYSLVFVLYYLDLHLVRLRFQLYTFHPRQSISD
jgi:hypothetical protein